MLTQFGGAGEIKLRATRKDTISKSQIILDLRRVARVLNHSPSSLEYAALGTYHVRTVVRKFGLSWEDIINTAGLCYTRRTFRPIPSTAEVTKDLERVAWEVGHPPTRREYELHGKFCAETVRRRSRKKEWADAVAEFTNFDREVIKHRQLGYRTTEEWLGKLRALSEELGHAPTTAESNEAGINSHNLCLRVGGGWVEVLQAAGIDLKSRTKYALRYARDIDVLINDVVRVYRRLGRPAKGREYAAHGRYPYSTLRNRLGGWNNVKSVVASRLRGQSLGFPQA